MLSRFAGALTLVWLLFPPQVVLAQPITSVTFNSYPGNYGSWIMQVQFEPNTATFAHVEITNTHINVAADGEFHQFALVPISSNAKYFLTVNGSSQSDVIEFYGESFARLHLHVTANSGDDAIRNFTANYLKAYGNSGDDYFLGGAADEAFFGGPGNDVAFGGPGEDSLYGEEDNDELYGEESNDLLEGGLGMDQMFGGPGDDSILGNSNTKELAWNGLYFRMPDLKQDQMSGGPGLDEFHYAYFYWEQLQTSLWNLPIAFRMYHEKDNVLDFNANQDSKIEHYSPKITIRL